MELKFNLHLIQTLKGQFDIDDRPFSFLFIGIHLEAEIPTVYIESYIQAYECSEVSLLLLRFTASKADE